MDTCFLFVKHLDDAGCFSLKISESEELIGPAIHRSFNDILALQKDARTFVVESSENATLIDLELAWLPERKARIAIPYALEDKLAQPVNELHFAFDKQRYQNNHYLITVISKIRLQHLIDTFKEHQIEFELITLDWFALSPQQFCINEANLLVNNGDFKGCLSGDLAQTYLNKHPLIQPLSFKESLITTEATQASGDSFTWIAKSLLKAKPLNLCQGGMQRGKSADWLQKGYQIVGALCGVWLFSLIVVNLLTLHSLNSKTKEVDQAIATIYREFFPDAKQVISPKFRIKQLLESNNSASQGHFWFLINQFAKAVRNDPLTVEQIRYQNRILSITIVTNDFVSLEAFENNLKKLQLKVKQTQASTRDKGVVATLELM